MNEFVEKRKYWYRYFRSEQFSIETLYKLLEIIDETEFWYELADIDNLSIEVIIKSGKKFQWSIYFCNPCHISIQNINQICEKILKNEIVNIKECLRDMPEVYMPVEFMLNKKPYIHWSNYFEFFTKLKTSLQDYNYIIYKGHCCYEISLTYSEKTSLLNFMNNNIKKLINEDIKDKDFWFYLPIDFYDTIELLVNKQDFINWSKFCFVFTEKQIRENLSLFKNKEFWKYICSSGLTFSIEEIINYQNYIDWNVYFDSINDKKVMNKLRKLLVNNHNFINVYANKYKIWYSCKKKVITARKKQIYIKKKINKKNVEPNYKKDFLEKYGIN